MDARGRFFQSIQTLSQPVEEVFGPLKITIPAHDDVDSESCTAPGLLKTKAQLTPQPLRDLASELLQLPVDTTQNQPVVDVVPDPDRRLRMLAEAADSHTIRQVYQIMDFTIDEANQFARQRRQARRQRFRGVEVVPDQQGEQRPSSGGRIQVMMNPTDFFIGRSSNGPGTTSAQTATPFFQSPPTHQPQNYRCIECPLETEDSDAMIL